MKKLIALLGAALLTLSCATQAASLDELKAQIAKRSQTIAEYKELLSVPDQYSRLAALDLMLQSDDDIMRDVAFKMGFASADEQMQALTLRHRLKSINNLLVVVEKDGTKTNDTLHFEKFDEKTGKIRVNLGNPYNLKDSYVVNTTLKGNIDDGNIMMQLEDGAKLVGVVTHKGVKLGIEATLL